MHILTSNFAKFGPVLTPIPFRSSLTAQPPRRKMAAVAANALLHGPLAVWFTSIFCAVLALSSCSVQDNSVSFKAMDTYMTVHSYGKNSGKANQQAEAYILELDDILSTTNPESQVYKLNHANGITVEVSSQVFNLAKFTLEGAKKTDGAFNPVLFPVTSDWGFTTKNYRVPGDEELKNLMQLTDYSKVQLVANTVNTSSDENTAQSGGQNTTFVSAGIIKMEPGMAFDFGAVGKGFAGDEAIKILKQNGITSAILDLGGNVQVLGKKPDGSNWKVGLKNPWGGQVPLALEVSDCAVITSGGYERFFVADDGNKYVHIFDGKTGKPVKNDVVSATIVTNSGLYGDFLSTTCFILGKEKTIEMWKTSDDFEFILLLEDHSLFYSKGLVDRITLYDAFTNVTVVE